MDAILHSKVVVSPPVSERFPQQFVSRDRYSTYTRSSAFLKKMRICLIYLWRHHRLPDLIHPTLFTELVQIRKLNASDYFISSLIDKIAVKNFVAAKIGEEWIIPTRWHGSRLPDAPVGPYPFIVKSSHGCNQYTVVRSQEDHWGTVKRQSEHWLRRPYGQWLDEGYYADVKPGLLIEPFVGKNGALPIDYKLYVFGGKACFVQVHLDRATHHRWAIFDLDWQCLTKETGNGVKPPVSLQKMIAAAELLATGMDFVRVDFYEINGKPMFGEMTFYPGSGLDPFNPPIIDAVMGAYWTQAKSKMKMLP
jgi:hypothetical protein